MTSLYHAQARLSPLPTLPLVHTDTALNVWSRARMPWFYTLWYSRWQHAHFSLACDPSIKGMRKKSQSVLMPPQCNSLCWRQAFSHTTLRFIIVFTLWLTVFVEPEIPFAANWYAEPCLKMEQSDHTSQKHRTLGVNPVWARYRLPSLRMP